MIKYNVELNWKEHSVNLDAFHAWAKDNCGADYCGMSSDANLRMHFLEEPSEEIKAAIVAQWEACDDAEHAMCTSYKSIEERKAEAEAKKVSGKAKLLALGLTEAEVAALVG